MEKKSSEKAFMYNVQKVKKNKDRFSIKWHCLLGLSCLVRVMIIILRTEGTMKLFSTKVLC